MFLYFSWDIFTYTKYYSIDLCNNCLSWLHSLSSVATYWIHQDTTVTTHFRSFISINCAHLVCDTSGCSRRGAARRGAARSVCDPLKQTCRGSDSNKIIWTQVGGGGAIELRFGPSNRTKCKSTLNEFPKRLHLFLSKIHQQQQYWEMLQFEIIHFKFSVFYSIFKCKLLLWCQSWIFSIITPVFSVKWSFRNNLNMLICCSIIIDTQLLIVAC